MTSQGSTAVERFLEEHSSRALCSLEELLQESALSMLILGITGQEASLMCFTLR